MNKKHNKKGTSLFSFHTFIFQEMRTRFRKQLLSIVVTLIAIAVITACTPPVASPPPDTGPVDDATYAEGYAAVLADMSASESDLYDEFLADPLTGFGTKTYNVSGSNGGSGSMTWGLTINSTTGTMTMTQSLSWSAYGGANETTINGSKNATAILTGGGTAYSGSASGYIVFQFRSGTGTINYSLTIDATTGNPVGTYTVKFDGETHEYDFLTNTEI